MRTACRHATRWLLGVSPPLLLYRYSMELVGFGGREPDSRCDNNIERDNLFFIVGQRFL